MSATDDATGKLKAASLVKDQLRVLLATGSLADAAAAKDRLQVLIERATQPETNRLWRAVGGVKLRCVKDVRQPGSFFSVRQQRAGAGCWL